MSNTTHTVYAQTQEERKKKMSDNEHIISNEKSGFGDQEVAGKHSHIFW